MQYPYISIYPNGVDPRTFFCDVNLQNKPLMDTYNNLIEHGTFTDAAIFLSQQNELHNYSADLFNFIEIKLNKLQEHVLKLEKYNPYQAANTEPSNINVGEMWI